MEKKESENLNVKNIKIALEKENNKSIMIDGKFGRGKTTSLDLALEKIKSKDGNENKKEKKFDVGGEIGNDNYLFFLYDELVVYKKKYLFVSTMILILIFALIKYPIFSIDKSNLISDINNVLYINITNFSISHLLFLIMILIYFWRYGGVLKFMIMKKLGLESSNIFLKKGIKKELKEYDYLIIDDLDRVYNKETLFEVMKLISYLYELISSKQINFKLVLIGDKKMINDRLNYDNKEKVDYLEKFVDETIPFVSQQEIILDEIEKEVGKSSISVIEDIENLRDLECIKSGVVDIKNRVNTLFFNIIRDPQTEEDKKIKYLFELLFDNKTQKYLNKEIHSSLNWKQILLLLRYVKISESSNINVLEHELLENVAVDKINLLEIDWRILNVDSDTINEHNEFVNKTIEREFLEFEKINDYINNHFEKEHILLLIMLSNYDLCDLNGLYDSSGNIRDRNELPNCVFSHIKRFNKYHLNENESVYLIETINTLLNLSNSSFAIIDGEIKRRTSTIHSQPPICDKSSEFFDLLFKTHIGDTLNDIREYIDFLKHQLNDDKVTGGEKYKEIFDQIERFLSNQLLYYYVKNLEINKYLECFNQLKEDGKEPNNQEMEFILPKVDLLLPGPKSEECEKMKLEGEEKEFYDKVKEYDAFN